MFEVGVVAHVESAHRLRGDFGPASRLHGHTYRLEVTARGSTLQPDGTLFDLTLLQNAVQDVVDTLHYRNLDDLPPFDSRNSTAENLAHHVYERIASRLNGLGVSSLAVRVWESPATFAGYQGPVPPA